MRKVRWWQLSLFLLLLALLVGDNCKQEPQPQTPTDERLKLYMYNPPSTYDCNNQSRFLVNLRPDDSSFTTGYLKIGFELRQSDKKIWESNDMDLPLNKDTLYTLEFGGNIESGEYQARGWLKYVGSETLGVTSARDYDITVTKKTSFNKTMHMEYDYQYRWDLGTVTFERLSRAFNIADTDTDILNDEQDMTPSYISIDSLGAYHLRHWSGTSGYNMHLLAVQGLKENQGQPKITTGISTQGPYGWTFIFVKDIRDFYLNDYDKMNVLYLTTIHELGHQRGGLTHASGQNAQPQNHNSPFCAMNQDIAYSGNNDDDPNNDPPGIKRWFELNPHFCDKCVNTVKNVIW